MPESDGSKELKQLKELKELKELKQGMHREEAVSSASHVYGYLVDVSTFGPAVESERLQQLLQASFNAAGFTDILIHVELVGEMEEFNYNHVYVPGADD